MLLIKFQKLNVWFDSAQGKSIEEENLYGTIIDLLSYWLAELHEVIDELTLPYETIGIDIRLTSPIKESLLPKSILTSKNNCSHEILGDKINKCLIVPSFDNKTLVLDTEIKLRISIFDIIEMVGIYGNKRNFKRG